MENLNTSFYKPTKFGQNEKGIENYQTVKKETIAYKKVFQPSLFDAELDNKTGYGKIQRKGASIGTVAPKLDKGEFAVVERKYSEIGMFGFTTRDNNKINSAADVAFIFRQLESEAVEHAFAVYVDKDKNPSVQWLSMGGINATVIDPRIMIDAAQRLKANEIYLVHNHPSGSLTASGADINIVEKLKRGFEPMGIQVNAIIINVISGNYLQFDENGSSIVGESFTSYDFGREKKIGVFSFNKQAFLQSPTNTKIKSPSDVAQFLSQQKFSSGEKAGYLLLTMKNEIVGNFFATQNTRNKAYKEVAGLVSKFGGVNVIAYTNKADIRFYKELKADLNNLEINLHDVIECESSAFVCQTFDKYKSLVQEGLLYEMETNYKTNKSKIMNTQFELGFGHLGNGTTVWNRLQMENNDYKTIAHISDNGQVAFYDNNLPEDVKKQISDMASIQRSENTRESLKTNVQAAVNQDAELIKVIPLTDGQKEDVSRFPYYEEEQADFPYDSLASVPEIIEGHELSFMNKLELLTGGLEFDNGGTTYSIDKDNHIRKDTLEANPNNVEEIYFKTVLLSKNDVLFNITALDNNNAVDVDVLDEMHQNSIDLGDEIYKSDEGTYNEVREEKINYVDSKQETLLPEESYLQKNLDYLNNQIKYLGFGNGFNEPLEKLMKPGSDKIDVPISKEFFSPANPEKKQAVDFTLHLSKGRESNMYFLNSYSAQLKGLSIEINEKQKFFINKGKGFTAKEAFNLLSDRAVNKDLTNKEGLTYNAWVKLKPAEDNGEKRNRDFQIFNENYGFDLKETLSKYPIKETETPEALDRLMNSLKKGNIQAVTFIQNGETSQKFISTNPQFKNLSVYNHDGSVMFNNSIVFNKSQDSQKQTVNDQPDISPVLKESKSAGMKR